MRHRAATAMLSAVALTLILAASALAGGWANAIMDTPPHDPGGPNQPITIGFTLLQHGVTPVDWGSAQVVLTNDATGQSVTVDARAQGAVGHWVAEISVPAEGTWSYEVRHDLEITMTGFDPIVVGAATGQPASTTAATGMAAQPALLLAVAFLGLLALAGATAGVIVLRRQVGSSQGSVAAYDWPALDRIWGGPRHACRANAGAPGPAWRLKRPARRAGRR